jgi:hypothetical protein
MTLKLTTYLASFAVAAFTSSASLAYTALAPQDSRLNVGLSLLEKTYEDDDNHTLDIDGNLLLIGYKAVLAPKFSLGGSFGLMMDGDITLNAGRNSVNLGGGSGYTLALDGDLIFTQVGQNDIIGLFSLSRDAYKFKEDGWKGEHSSTELMLGGGLRHNLNKVGLYAGLQFTLMSDGEWDTNNDKEDTEVENKLDLHLAVTYAVDNAINLRGDLLLLGQETVLLGADFHI